MKAWPRQRSGGRLALEDVEVPRPRVGASDGVRRARGLALGVALAVAGLTGRAAAQPVVVDPAKRVHIAFVEPGRFTDVKAGCLGSERESALLLAEIEEFLREVAEPYVRGGTSLEIDITDIDLAGRFEPPRPPEPCGGRVLDAADPPHITLAFRLTDDDGHVERQGRRDLRDPTYLSRTVVPMEDPLRYEKNLLRYWLREELASGKPS